MDEQPSLSAARQARYKGNLADRGVKQINLIAPANVHDILRAIASRTRAGEDLAAVLVALTQAHAGKRLSKLEMRGERLANALAALKRAPEGKVNVAIALADKATGGLRTKLRGLGLLYQGMTFSGAVDESLIDDIRRRVEASGGAMLTA